MRSAYRIALNRRPGARRVVIVVVLAAFVFTAAGVPLPTGTATKSTKLNDAFLCATSSCGCATAEQCWRSCCCHSLSTRLEWARTNGVRPPDFAIAAASAAGYDLSWLDQRNQADAKLVCHSKNCCERTSAPAVRSCCSNKKDTQPARTVVAWRALKCGGHSMNWLAAVPTLVSVHTDLAPVIAPPTWLPPPASDHQCGTAQPPIVPPPERV
jgi:hypothetical protein